ncbi:MAG: protein kinase [Candidatus Berkiella sp.]
MILAASSNKRKPKQAEVENPHKHYDKWLRRLNATQEQRPPSALQNLVSSKDLTQIFHYFTLKTKQRYTRAKLNTDKHIAHIKALKPYESYRLDKQDTKLPRTLTVLCDEHGDLKLIIETKSKLANNKKMEIANETGGFKIGKPAWQIDEFQEYYNLVTKIKSDLKNQLLEEEVEKSQRLTSKYINQTQLGPIIQKGNIKKRSVYAKKAVSDLEQFIQKNNLSAMQIKTLTHQLLQALKYMHDNNMVHQDLKSPNILVFNEEPNGLQIKITDFGNASTHNADEEAMASFEYCSPEILSFYKMSDTTQHNYFFKDDKHECFAKSQLSPVALRSLGKPHKANDIWAMGVLLFELRYGKLPKLEDRPLIEKDSLLKGMLCVNRKERYTIDKALAVFDEAQVTRKARRSIINRK